MQVCNYSFQCFLTCCFATHPSPLGICVICIYVLAVNVCRWLRWHALWIGLYIIERVRLTARACPITKGNMKVYQVDSTNRTIKNSLKNFYCIFSYSISWKKKHKHCDWSIKALWYFYSYLFCKHFRSEYADFIYSSHLRGTGRVSGRQLFQNCFCPILKKCLLYKESKFFPYRIDLFSEGTWHAATQTGFQKLSLFAEMTKKHSIVFSPLNKTALMISSESL